MPADRSSVTARSTSDSGEASPRAVDPNNDSRASPSARRFALLRLRRAMAASRSMRRIWRIGSVASTGAARSADPAFYCPTRRSPPSLTTALSNRESPTPLARTLGVARGFTSSTCAHAAVANAATGSAITLSAPPSILLRSAPQSGRWRSAK